MSPWGRAARLSIAGLAAISCGREDASPGAAPEEATVADFPAPAGRWRCRSCDAWHDELPMAFHLGAPAYWAALPDGERRARGVLAAETCEIDGHYFILGLIEIPVHDRAEPFAYGVWISQSEANYRKAIERWTAADREGLPATFGWLSNELPGYPSTLNLKTMLHQRAPGLRPWVELEPTDHPLAVEQREGISIERVKRIAELHLHP